MGYELATSTNLAYDKTGKVPFLDGVERIINAGFKNLDYNFLDMIDYPNPFLSDNYKEWMYECRDFVEKRGAKWVQAHSVATGAKKDFDKFVEDQKRSIECCSYLGVEWTVHHHISNPKYTTGSSMSPLDFNLKMFDELLKIAEKYKVGIAIENNTTFPFFEGNHVEESTENLITLVDKLGSEFVGICWDVGHANINAIYKNSQHLADQSEQLRMVGDRLKATHVHDNNAKRLAYCPELLYSEVTFNPHPVFDEHIQPYLGTIDWNDVIKGLDDIKYSHYFTYEAHAAVNKLPSEVLDDGISMLRKIGEYIVGMSKFN